MRTDQEGETLTLRQLCEQHTALLPEDITCLEHVAHTMQYTADLTGSDMFIDCMDKAGTTAVVVAQAKPSGDFSAYGQTVLGQQALEENEPAVYCAFRTGLTMRDLKAITQENISVRQDATPVKNSQGTVIGVLIREKDVSRTLRQEKKFEILARERDDFTGAMLGLSPTGQNAAMKEIHHRVKNNLQLVASILNIQARKSSDPYIQQVFRENTGKVLSIAAIHDILTTTEHSDCIELTSLLGRVRREIQFLNQNGKEIAIVVEGEQVFVSSDKATSIALVVHELATNALAHGFQGRTQGVVSIRVERRNRYTSVIVEDDGEGFDPSRIRSDSLGMEIITQTVRDKLGGEFQLSTGPHGTKAMFDFLA